MPPADTPNAALRGSAVAASAAVAAASSALPAGAADEYLNYNMTGGVEMGRRSAHEVMEVSDDRALHLQ